ncbi:hypothetical protein XENOCAPTIV_012059 [Xenoophorus captivus]|uniref:Uncharacterized protein n=1 Tax=Xenoophorus captivus TaxID=1517983 RepID=A0ABV0RRP0_9TELE
MSHTMLLDTWSHYVLFNGSSFGSRTSDSSVALLKQHQIGIAVQPSSNDTLQPGIQGNIRTNSLTKSQTNTSFLQPATTLKTIVDLNLLLHSPWIPATSIHPPRRGGQGPICSCCCDEEPTSLEKSYVQRTWITARFVTDKSLIRTFHRSHPDQPGGPSEAGP